MAIVYVDPTNGDDTTGDGSSGNPYASIQGAHNAATLSATAGNTIYLANTSADVLSAILSLAKATLEAPLTIAGWDNGGSLTLVNGQGTTITCGEINGNDAVARITASVLPYVTFKSIKLHSTTSYVVDLARTSSLIDCEIYNGATAVVVAYDVFRCHIYNDISAYGIWTAQNANIRMCDIHGVTHGIHATTGLNNNFEFNRVWDVTNVGITFYSDSGDCRNNSIDGSGCAVSAVGIKSDTGALAEQWRCYDNIVANFSNTSCVGFKGAAGSPPALTGNNAYFNNTTNISGVPTAGFTLSDITETSDPFTSGATGDLSLVPGALSNGAGLLNSPDPSNPLNVGAWQDDAAGGAVGTIIEGGFSM